MDSVHRVLFIRFSAIGDILLLTPLIHLFHKHYPDVQIDFLIRADFAELIEYNPLINDVVLLPKSPTIREVFKVAKIIRQRNYSILFDFQKHWRTYLISFFSAGVRVYRYKKYAIPRFLLTFLKINLYQNIPETIPERYFIAFRKLKIIWHTTSLEIHIPDKIQKNMAPKLTTQNNETLIAIAPGAGRNTKRWPHKYFIQLIKHLQNYRRVKVVLVGGNTDKMICESIENECRDNLVNLCGATSLLETASVLQKSHLVISNDTGVLHMATALQCKVLAIFGSTVKEFGFFPTLSEHSIIEHSNLKCRPCSYHGSDSCPQNHFRCMKEIEPNRVLKAAIQLLEPGK